MLNIGKYAAIAAAGLGIAAVAAPQAEACGFVKTFGCARISMGGYGSAMAMYRPVTMLRPVLAYRPVTTFRPVYGYAYRPSYGAAYGYAPRYRVYRPLAFRYRPATYAWAAPRIHVFHPLAFRTFRPAAYAWAAPRIHVFRPLAYGAAFGYMPRYRPIYAYGCGC